VTGAAASQHGRVPRYYKKDSVSRKKELFQEKGKKTFKTEGIRGHMTSIVELDGTSKSQQWSDRFLEDGAKIKTLVQDDFIIN
jgi:hypothetical protein